MSPRQKKSTYLELDEYNSVVVGPDRSEVDDSCQSKPDITTCARLLLLLVVVVVVVVVLVVVMMLRCRGRL